MLDWMVWNPIQAGVVGAICAVIYFSLIHILEKKIQKAKEREQINE